MGKHRRRAEALEHPCRGDRQGHLHRIAPSSGPNAPHPRADVVGASSEFARRTPSLEQVILEFQPEPKEATAQQMGWSRTRRRRLVQSGQPVAGRSRSSLRPGLGSGSPPRSTQRCCRPRSQRWPMDSRDDPHCICHRPHRHAPRRRVGCRPGTRSRARFEWDGDDREPSHARL